MGLVGKSYVEFDADLRPAFAKLDQLLAKAQQVRQQVAQIGAGASVPGAGRAAPGGGLGTSDVANAERAAVRYAASLAQAQRAQGNLTGAAKTWQTVLDQLTPNTLEYNRALAGLAKAENDVAKAAKNAQPGGGGSSGGGGAQSILNLAKGYLTLQAAEKGLEFARLGAEAGAARTSFDNLAASAKTTGSALLTSLRSASDGTIANTALIKSANTGLLLTQGRIAKDLPQLITIARASAQATGQSVDFIFDSLTRGIARGSPMIIDNAGITLDAAGAFEAYAKSIGKSADTLTKAEQQQATLNAVLKAGDDIVKQVGISAESDAAKIDRATTAVKNLRDTLAARAAPVVGGAAENLVKGLGIGENRDQLSAQALDGARSFAEFQKAARDANRELLELYGARGGQSVKVQALTQAQFDYAKALQATGLSADAALRMAVNLNGADERRIQTLTAMAPLIGQVSAFGADERTQVLGLINAYGQNAVSGDQVNIVLQAMVRAHARAAEAAAYENLETQRLTRTSAAGAQTATAYGAALADSLKQQQASTQTSQDLAKAQATLASLGDAVQKGLITASAGADALAQAYGIARNEAFKLISAQAQLAGAQAARDRAETANNAALLARANRGGRITQARQTAEQIKLENDLKQAEADRIERTGTAAQKLALAQQQQAAAIKKYGANSREAYDAGTKVIEAQQAVNEAAKKGAGSATKGLGALDRDAIDLAGDYQAQLAEVNRQLEKGNLTAHQRNQLLKEQADLQDKIASATEKQQDAALSAEAASLENIKASKQEGRQLDFLDKLATAGGSRGEDAAIEARLIRIRAEQRTRALNREVRDAGGVVPSLGTAPLAAPSASGTPAAATGGAAGPGAIAGGPINFYLQIGEQVLATAVANGIANNQRVTFQANRAAGVGG